MANQITISWTASPGPISGYNVRRGTAIGNESSVPLNATPIVGTSYTDNTVYPGQIYSYEVTAVYNGVESAESLQVLSTPVPFGVTPLTLDFGAASSFAVLAASTVTNVSGTDTSISGDVGVSPGSSITGFGSPVSISGVFHAGDFVAAAAQSAVLNSFNQGMALPDGYILPGDLGGSILLPGIYVASSSLQITGSIILDAAGDPNAVWIFQIGSTLTTASSDSAVVLVGGAQADNVFWLVGSSATLNSNTSFAGNILAMASISVASNVRIEGRLLAMTGAVTLDDDQIILFETGSLAIRLNLGVFILGQIIFDGVNFQEVTTAGNAGATPPVWATTFGATTQDGTIVWTMISAVGDIVVLKGLPPSLPNLPPAPPAAPTNLTIVSET